MRKKKHSTLASVSDVKKRRSSTLASVSDVEKKKGSTLASVSDLKKLLYTCKCVCDVENYPQPHCGLHGHGQQAFAALAEWCYTSLSVDQLQAGLADLCFSLIQLSADLWLHCLMISLYTVSETYDRKGKMIVVLFRKQIIVASFRTENVLDSHFSFQKKKMYQSFQKQHWTPCLVLLCSASVSFVAHLFPFLS